MQLEYQSLKIYKVFSVTSIVSVNYHEFGVNFSFPEEHHRCWEMCYVDTGEFSSEVDGRAISMTQGEMLLIPPMLPHAIRDCRDAPNVCNIAFESNSELLYPLSGHILSLSRDARKAISSIMTLSFRFTNKGITHAYVNSRSGELTVSQMADLQMIASRIEELFLMLTFREEKNELLREKILIDNSRQTLVSRVTEYIHSNIEKKLTIDMLCSLFLVSRAKLCKDFRETVGCSIKEYINDHRLKMAKRMVRKEDLNFTEISLRLGFANVNYFSSWFKEHTSLSPTEYIRSVNESL